MASRGLFAGSSVSTRYAGFVSRLAAFMIDLLIVSVTVTVTSAVSLWFGRTLDLGKPTRDFLTAITALGNLLLIVAYYVGFVALAGQTPGKRIMGLRVIMMNGEKVSVRRSIRRYVGYFLSLPLFWGYLIVLVDDGRRAFHDRFAGTRVIYDK